MTPKPVGQLVRQRLERITLPRPEVPLASPAPAEDLTERARYEQLLVRVRDVVRSVLPAGATVIVVNKGDDQLLKLGRRHGWHFPQTANGEYAGYYPADSATAVAHLNVLREKGGRYLLLPQTAFWWLSHYLAFGQYLSQNCRTVAQVEDTCIIYDLESREQGGD